MADAVYPGSLFFSGLAAWAGMPVDQVNFLLGQLAGLLAACLFRLRLPPGRVGATARHLAAAGIGLAVLLLCYGRDTKHVIAQAALNYGVIRLAPAHSVHRLCLLAAMAYLTVIHYWRLGRPQQYIDISGPVMVLTMKTTLLAFNLHDASRAASGDVELKPMLRSIAVSKAPSLVEFAGYAFNFQTVLVGPMIDFSHYRHFIEVGLSPTPLSDKASSDDNDNLVSPSPTPAVLRKMVLAMITSACVVFLVPLVPHSFFKEEAYHAWSWRRQWGYMYLSGMMARMKYYAAWTLAEAVCNASGLGYSGRRDDGSQRWGAAANVNVWKVEFGSSFREVLEGWNVGTGRWLRLVAYERASRHRTAAVYALSALWHGLDPCYYATFAVGALCTQAGREGRRCLRPRFQRWRAGRLLYHLAGWVATRACPRLPQIPFVLLDMRTSLRVSAPKRRSKNGRVNRENGRLASDVMAAGLRHRTSNGTGPGPMVSELALAGAGAGLRVS
ncbi:membrane-bound O-acyltransferase domain-containing protein 2-like [Pollicipes pollicipes]|uniref:membrane-bound O-acyltransferase domain-containing protein 2-like n=1 Tax=Pollicipes pollicipes TaxID=41117 RepID=UPI001885515F|nr:membrane-bound O-acyltransferase domain-containing protein 2-like [Pollicipes pollicipes]